MAVARTDRMKTNEDFVRSYAWAETDGTPYLLSDAAIQVRVTADAEEVLLSASVSDGKITLESVENGGWANIVVPVEEVRTITYYGIAKYDLVLTRASDGRVKTITEGDMIIEQGVTR